MKWKRSKATAILACAKACSRTRRLLTSATQHCGAAWTCSHCAWRKNMQPEQHLEIAARIERSLKKCGPEDHEMRIEAAMLAGTHRLNAVLHRTGVTAEGSDVFHSYLLTVNEF